MKKKILLLALITLTTCFLCLPKTLNVKAETYVTNDIVLTPQITLINSDGDSYMFLQDDRTFYNGLITTQFDLYELYVERTPVEIMDNYVQYESYVLSVPRNNNIVGLCFAYSEPIYLSRSLFSPSERTTIFGFSFYSFFGDVPQVIANYTLTCDVYYIHDGELIHVPYSVSAQNRWTLGSLQTYLPIGLEGDIFLSDYVMIANYNLTYSFSSQSLKAPDGELDVSCPLINSSTYTSYVTSFNNLSLDLDLYSSIFPSIESFFTYPVFGLFSIGDVLSVIVCIIIVLIALKYFGGG